MRAEQRSLSKFDFMDLLAFLIIGLIAGWIASLIVRGRGLGLVGDLAVGIVGAVLGGYLIGDMGIGLTGSIISAIIGTIILLLIIKLIPRS